MTEPHREGVVSGFLAHIVRAVRCWRADPRLPLTVFVIWVLETVPYVVGRQVDATGIGLASSLVLLATLGFLGALRIWYLEIEAGRRMPGSEVYEASKRLWSRYFGLGVLAWVVILVPGVAFVVISRSLGEIPSRVGLFVMMYVVDVLLTFATVVLALFDITAGAAIQYSWQVTKAQWPASALYVLVAPLALHLAFVAVPATEMPLAVYLAVSLATAAFALACKGATVLFYADRYLTHAAVAPEPEPLPPPLPPPPPIN
ncbi:MAG: hypothetical protein U0W40_01985 [Acidimicrobiia bacterium]